jgi:AraC family transcriptional regulator
MTLARLHSTLVHEADEESVNPGGRVVQVLGHGYGKFPTGELFESSVRRGWVGLLAERRSHPAGDLPTFTPAYTEIAMLVRGRSTVTRRADGTTQRTSGSRGTFWLCPAGLKEDFLQISHDIPEVLHVYLPPKPFSILEGASETVMDGVEVRYQAGFQDPLLEQIAHIVLAEMHNETSSGKLLIETLALGLAARLHHSYSTAARNPDDLPASRHGLDRRRLGRVLEYIEVHLEQDLSVGRLAAIASLSHFHFARSFKQATGRSPHQYVSDRRLCHAKSLLADSDRSLEEIARACCFSSQANFSRAFYHATGVTPGRYRAGQREEVAVPRQPFF